MNMDFVEKLISLRNTLLSMTRVTGATITLRSIVNTHFPDFEDSRKEKMIEDHISCVREAAVEGYNSFMKHIEKTLPKYVLRRRFHISFKPTEGPRTADDEFWLSQGKEFFGCSIDEYNIDLINQWFAYRDEWNSLHSSKPEWSNQESNYYFWSSRQHKWPDLVQCALWYSNWPTSSISAERTFALGRIVDGSQRGRQSWEIFAREMKMKANSAILKRLLTDKLDYVSNMSKPN